MPKTCSYELCKNDQFRPGIRFFKFPLAHRDPERRRLWAVRCNRRNVDGHTWEPNPKTKYVYVCSDHFITGEPWNSKSHPDYAPSLLCRTADCPETQKATKALRRFTMALNRTLRSSTGSQRTSAISSGNTTICTANPEDNSIQTISSPMDMNADTSSLPNTTGYDPVQKQLRASAAVPSQFASTPKPSTQTLFRTARLKTQRKRIGKISLKVPDGKASTDAILEGDCKSIVRSALLSKMKSSERRHKRPLRARSRTEQRSDACERCGEVITDTDNINQEGMREEYPESPLIQKPINSLSCDGSFDDVSSLKMHVQIHAEQRPDSWLVSGEEFAQTILLNAHVASYVLIPYSADRLCESSSQNVTNVASNLANCVERNLIKNRLCANCMIQKRALYAAADHTYAKRRKEKRETMTSSSIQNSDIDSVQADSLHHVIVVMPADPQEQSLTDDECYKKEAEDECHEKEAEDECYKKEAEDECYKKEAEDECYKKEAEDESYEKEAEDECYEKKVEDECYKRESVIYTDYRSVVTPYGCGVCDVIFEIEKEFFEHCSNHFNDTSVKTLYSATSFWVY